MDRDIYTRHTTRELAERTLEDMFATGEIVEGEHPLIERRGHYWCITLRDYAAKYAPQNVELPG